MKYLFIFFFLTLISFTKQQEYTKISLDNSLFVKLDANNSRKYYNLTIENPLKNQDLFILVENIDRGTTHPNLEVSKNSQDFSEKNLLCNSFGFDLCSIPSANITKNIQLYIKVYCEKICYFKIKVFFQNDYYIKVNTEYKLYFYSDSVVNFKVTFFSFLLNNIKFFLKKN